MRSITKMDSGRKKMMRERTDGVFRCLLSTLLVGDIINLLQLLYLAREGRHSTARSVAAEQCKAVIIHIHIVNHHGLCCDFLFFDYGSPGWKLRSVIGKLILSFIV
jgi:hypothetical protein